ncbi:glycosyltransferase family 2 protein [Desulfosediminicola ganghwensis]|uniref:glycosyltransferase family 2 protein n=1 Tax=Desulfosediminicola ganghwensis TaxID=2569540 RepID=UPI0010ACF862|nr:glycosyltransferase [Desulfosediminicola ganghwensis]
MLVQTKGFFLDVLLIFQGFFVTPLAHLDGFILKFVPFALFLEFPLYLLIVVGVFFYLLRKRLTPAPSAGYVPSVSCIALCYSEEDAVKLTIRSLTEQIYEGPIEILAIMDGAAQNASTYRAAKSMEAYVSNFPNRTLRIIPKWQRGGRVSSMNLGLSLSQGEIVMALDGDTSFDNDMVFEATRPFTDDNVVSVAGNLRVRNITSSLITKLQAIEYLISIYLGKTGLSEFNIVNNISGAFGIHRRQFLEQVGGWDAGTAEDLDLTIRIKGYLGRYPSLRIVFAPKAIGHTDAPVTLRQFFSQRLRWDGDLLYLYLKKHKSRIRPGLLGWRNSFMMVWTGLFFQIVMPFLIVLYTVYIIVVFPPELVAAIMLFIYLAYLVVSAFMYLVFLIFLSERQLQDAALIFYLPFFPIFSFVVRVWSAVASLKELIQNAHLDSSMAPWWVLKKTKF